MAQLSNVTPSMSTGDFNIDIVTCLFCRASIHFTGLPAHRYKEHLFKEHNILFDIDSVIVRTLSQQKSGNVNEKEKECSQKSQEPSKKTADASCQTDDLPELPKLNIQIVKDRGCSEEDEAPQTNQESQNGQEPVSSYRGPTLRKRHSSTVSKSSSSSQAIRSTKLPKKRMKNSITLPWYAGCEYQCQLCWTTFFYVQELRSHILKQHKEIKIADYLNKHKQFETKTVYATCRICRKQIKRNFSSFVKHLDNEHVGTTMDSYAKRFSLKNYDLVFSEDVDESELETPEGCEFPGNEDTEVPETSKWYEGCEYQCRICNEVFYESKALLSHALNLHFKTKKQYRKKFRQYETKTVYYSCQICSGKIKKSRVSIQTHLLSTHSISMEDYENQYIPSNQKAEENTPANTFEQFKEAPQDDNVNVDEDSVIEGDTFESYQTFISGDCLFKCKICSMETNSSREFWNHSKSEHGKTVKEYKIAHGNPCIRQTSLECKACGKLLRNEPGTLTAHAKLSHFMSVKNFYLKYYQRKIDKAIMEWSNQCEFQCKLCLQKFYDNTLIRTHIKKEHLMEVKDYVTNFGDVMTKRARHICKICGSNGTMQYISMKNHLIQNHQMTIKKYYEDYFEDLSVKAEENETNSDVIKKTDDNRQVEETAEQDSSPEDLKNWGNQCIYQCAICNKIFKKDCNLRSHIRKSHHLSLERYTKKHGDYKLKFVQHTCKICLNKVKHEAKNIESHCKIIHGLTLEDYFRQYILESSQGVSPKVNTPPTSSKKKQNLKFEVIDWINGCVCKCQLCSKLFKKPGSLAKHVSIFHNLTGSNYIQKFGAYTTEKKFIQCKICKMMVTHRRTNVTAHLRKRHQMTAEEYYKKFIVEIADSLSDIADGENQELSRSSLGVKAICKDDEGFKKWISHHTIISCPMCQRSFQSEKEFFDHAGTIHEMSASTFLKTHGALRIKNKHRRCVLCQKLTSHKAFLSHLSETHHISPETYYSNYVANKNMNPKRKTASGGGKVSVKRESSKAQAWSQRCLFKCKMCFFSSRNRSVFERHILNRHKVSSSKYINQYGKLETKVTYHKCRICRKKIQHEAPYLREHFKEHAVCLQDYFAQYVDVKGPKASEPERQDWDKRTGEIVEDAEFVTVDHDVHESSSKDEAVIMKHEANWMNGCVYLCKACTAPTPIYSKKMFRHHIETSHGLTYETYLQKHGNPNSLLKLYICKCCNESLIHDEEDIATHLSDVHSLTSDDYYAEYEEEQYIAQADPEDGSDFIVSNPISIQVEKNQPCQSRGSEVSHTHSRHKDTSVADKVQTRFNWNLSVFKCKLCERFIATGKRCSCYDGTKEPHSPNQKHPFDHQCRICYKDIRLKSYNMRKHVATHGLQLEEYEERFFAELQVEFNDLNAIKESIATTGNSSNANIEELEMNYQNYLLPDVISQCASSSEDAIPTSHQDVSEISFIKEELDDLD